MVTRSRTAPRNMGGRREREDLRDDTDRVMDELNKTFLSNLPSDVLRSTDRLLLMVEKAHWEYVDVHRERNRLLPLLQLKDFTYHLFARNLALRRHLKDVDSITADFLEYKRTAPTSGAAILNDSMDKVLLVRGWGKGAKWGFPKGKVEHGETMLDTAVREVFEETGFDLRNLIEETTPHIDCRPAGGRYSRIYLVKGIAETTVFQAQTRKEVSNICWVPVQDLPDSPAAAREEKRVTLHSTGPERSTKVRNVHFSIAAFGVHVRALRAWISEQSGLRRWDQGFDSAKGKIGRSKMTATRGWKDSYSAARSRRRRTYFE